MWTHSFLVMCVGVLSGYTALFLATPFISVFDEDMDVSDTTESITTAYTVFGLEMYVSKYKKEDNQDIMPSMEIINVKCSHACGWAPSHANHASHAYTHPTRMYRAQFNV